MNYLIQCSLLCALLSLCATAGLAQTSQPTSTPAATEQTVQWKEFAPPDSGFKIQLPGKPKKMSSSTKIGKWSSLGVSFDLQHAGAQYSLSYFDVAGLDEKSQLAQDLLNSLRQGMLTELSGQVVQEKAILWGGHPGRLLVVTTDKHQFVRSLLVAVGQRLYRFDAQTPGNTEAEQQTAARLFNSLEFIPLKPGRAVDEAVSRMEVVGPGSGSFAQLAQGGLLNGKAIKKPQPPYPSTAKLARVSGTVVVEIVVDEEGKVIAAQATSGPDLLRETCVRASREARFTPTTVDGKPVKVRGYITYTFVLM